MSPTRNILCMKWGTRIAIFHGSPKLQEAIDGSKLSARRYSRPAPWVKERWK